MSPIGIGGLTVFLGNSIPELPGLEDLTGGAPSQDPVDDLDGRGDEKVHFEGTVLIDRQLLAGVPSGLLYAGGNGRRKPKADRDRVVIGHPDGPCLVQAVEDLAFGLWNEGLIQDSGRFDPRQFHHPDVAGWVGPANDVDCGAQCRGFDQIGSEFQPSNLVPRPALVGDIDDLDQEGATDHNLTTRRIRGCSGERTAAAASSIRRPRVVWCCLPNGSEFGFSLHGSRQWRKVRCLPRANLFV